MLKSSKFVVRFPRSNRYGRQYCNQHKIPIAEPTNEVDAGFIALMKDFGNAKQLQSENKFMQASQILSQAIQKWKAKAYGESEMALLQPLLKLAELYQSQGLDQKSHLIYEELDSMITHVLIELQQSLDIETNIEKRADLEKKIKSLRVLLANTMIDCGKLYLDNEDYALAQKKIKEGISLITMAGHSNSYHMQFAYAMLGLLYENVGNFEDAEWYHIDVLKNSPSLEIWNHPHFGTVLNPIQLLKYSRPILGNATIQNNDITSNNKTSINETNSMQSPSNEELLQERITAEEMLNLIRKNKKMGPTQIHPSIVSLMIFVSFILRQEGQFTESVAILSSLYDYYSAKEKKASVATLACHLGMVYAEQGDFPTAERYFKEALHTRNTLLGSSHIHTALVSADLSLIFWKQGEAHNAVHLLTSAIRIFEKELTHSHPFTQLLKKTYQELETAFVRIVNEQENTNNNTKE